MDDPARLFPPTFARGAFSACFVHLATGLAHRLENAPVKGTAMKGITMKEIAMKEIAMKEIGVDPIMWTVAGFHAATGE
ncbi:hypothetical protein [Salinibacter altiplanensis]|uniref:hypothetical protein n=1 Tax=Salinibacter altiplanensis TaxID=1803181 RepID=UPI0018F88E22|nr:hypothetical protein [Salinibacter altiplanensis]